MTLPTPVGHVPSYGTSTTARVLTPHVSTQDGDLMIAVFAANAQAISPPSDPTHPWTLIRTVETTGTMKTSAYYRLRVAGETAANATYTFTIAASGTSTQDIITVRGWDTSKALIIGTSGDRGTTGTSTTTVAKSITTTAADTLALVIATERTTATETDVTSVSNFTEDHFVPQNGSTGLETIFVGKKNMAAAGATGDVTITYPQSQSLNALGYIIGIPGVVASNVAPTASFTSSVTGQVVSVDGTASSDSDGTISSYDWDWGDGTTHGSGSTASHTYTTSGTFTVQLTVTDNGGATGSVSHSVNVNVFGYPAIILTSGGTKQPGRLFYFDGTTKHDLNTGLVAAFKPTTVSEFLSVQRSPWVGAHRGFSNNYPEETLYSYRGATDAGVKAIEISVQYSADGTPWCFHDAYLDRTVLAGNPSTTTLQISTMHDAAIAAYSNLGSTASLNNTQPARPVAKLTDVLDAYYKTHVIIVEDKTYTHTSAMLTLLSSYGTADRPVNEIFIWKATYDATKSTNFDAAAAIGLHRWAYIFDSNMAADFATLVASGKADMIGMDFNSPDATLTPAIAACIANGVRPTAHIISSTTQRDRLLGLGMTGLMMSNKLAYIRKW